MKERCSHNFSYLWDGETLTINAESGRMEDICDICHERVRALEYLAERGMLEKSVTPKKV